MYDDLDHLRAKDSLYQLLVHYARLAEPDRAVWQDRVMTMDDLEPADISKLHGELIAFGWVEQNTGNSAGMRAGVVPACYRVTLAGIRALEQIQNPESLDADEVSTPLARGNHFARSKRMRPPRQKPEPVESQDPLRVAA